MKHAADASRCMEWSHHTQWPAPSVIVTLSFYRMHLAAYEPPMMLVHTGGVIQAQRGFSGPCCAAGS
jgi:hypothetical protein